MTEQEIELSVEDRSRYVRALYAFEAKDDTQLTIKPGDILEVFYRDESGWWDGKNVSTQNDGYFPGNYTESLGEDLDVIKQQLLLSRDHEAEQSDERNHRNHHIHNEHEHDDEHHHRHEASNSQSNMSSIKLISAEPWMKRCYLCLKNDCFLCSIHHRALCIYLTNKTNTLYFEYDAYAFRSLSTVQHTLCIFGAVSCNHFISSLIYDIYHYAKEDVHLNYEPILIRLTMTILLTIGYILFLFATSNTALMFLKESPNNKQSTDKRDRNIRQRRSMLSCCCLRHIRNISLKCGKCGVKSCRPYTFIYTQFIMLLCCYILAFLWQDLCLDLQLKYLSSVRQDWYKNIVFMMILLIVSLFALFLLKRKLNCVYHIYRYYSREIKEEEILKQRNINRKKREKRDRRESSHTRPYQVALYLYFWCLLTEVTLFIFALPLGSCFAAFVYSTLSLICTKTMTRIIEIMIYIVAFFIVYICSWKLIHSAIHKKKQAQSQGHGAYAALESNPHHDPKLMMKNAFRMNSIYSINSMNSSTGATATSSSYDQYETQSALTISSSAACAAHDAIKTEENEMIAEYESDIPDFMMLILMKYYGAEIEATEFAILSLVLWCVFVCDIFLIGFWFNVWMLFDNDCDPFNNVTNDEIGHVVNENDAHQWKQLLYIAILTCVLPLISSYLFGKTFRYFCCRRKNYKLSTQLERDKLFIKSLLSRWFIVIQSLLIGYLWCSYFQRLWFHYIDTKYYTLTTALWAICIYCIIFIVIVIFKLNKKLLRLLWTMHHDDDVDEKNKKEIGNLGLSESVKSKQLHLEKKLARSMISHNTQKAKKAVVVCSPQNNENNENNEIVEIQLNHKNRASAKRNNEKTSGANDGLSTSLLQSDDDEDAQIL